MTASGTGPRQHINLERPSGAYIMRRKVKSGLYNLSIADVIIHTQNVNTGMTGNANFPQPNPAMAMYAAAIADLGAAQAAVAANGGKNNTTLRNVALRTVKTMTMQLVTYVNNVGNGDEAVLLSSGFPLVELPSPVGKLSPPEGCKVTTEGQNAGAVKFYHNGRKKRIIYVYQVRKYQDGMAPEMGWEPEVTSSERIHVFTGLVSGERYQFRVAVISSVGRGDWSQLLMLRPQ